MLWKWNVSSHRRLILIFIFFAELIPIVQQPTLQIKKKMLSNFHYYFHSIPVENLSPLNRIKARALGQRKKMNVLEIENIQIPCSSIRCTNWPIVSMHELFVERIISLFAVKYKKKCFCRRHIIIENGNIMKTIELCVSVSVCVCILFQCTS